MAQRARIILACAAGETNTTVAERLRVTKQTIGNGTFIHDRLVS
jgi:DNA-binding NarL/FixJ family response regulator